MQYQHALLICLTLLASIAPLQASQKNANSSHQQNPCKKIVKRSFLNQRLVTTLQEINVEIKKHRFAKYRQYLSNFYVDPQFNPYPIFQSAILSIKSKLSYHLTNLTEDEKRAWTIKILQSICKIGKYKIIDKQYFIPIMLPDQKLILELHPRKLKEEWQLSYKNLHKHDEFLSSSDLSKELLDHVSTLEPFSFANQRITGKVNINETPIFLIIKVYHCYEILKITKDSNDDYHISLMKKKREIKKPYWVKVGKVALGRFISDTTGNIEIVMKIKLRVYHVDRYYIFALIKAKKYVTEEKMHWNHCYVGQKLVYCHDSYKVDHAYAKLTLIYQLGQQFKQEQKKESSLTTSVSQDNEVAYTNQLDLTNYYYAQDECPTYQVPSVNNTWEAIYNNVFTDFPIFQVETAQLFIGQSMIQLPLVICNKPLEQVMPIDSSIVSIATPMPLQIINNTVTPLATIPISLPTPTLHSNTLQSIPTSLPSLSPHLSWNNMGLVPLLTPSPSNLSRGISTNQITPKEENSNNNELAQPSYPSSPLSINIDALNAQSPSYYGTLPSPLSLNSNQSYHTDNQ